MTTLATATIPFPKALARFPRLRQSLLGAFDACALEARLAQELEYLGDLDDPDRMQWNQPWQARGTTFHRWAAKLLDTLDMLKQDGLTDSVECKRCGARPNEDREEHEAELPEFRERQPCPRCSAPLMRVPLTQLALDMLADVLRQDDVPDQDVVRVPQNHAKDLEWIVTKFAREQRFKIANYMASEQRMEAVLEYPNPHGGVVERTLTGAIDAWFLEQDPDGKWHAYVIDWKDTWGIPGRTTISAGGYWQQRFYAWLLMKQPDLQHVERVTLCETYVRFRAGESGRDNVRMATIHRSKLPIIQAQLGVVAESFDRAWEAFEDWRALASEWDTSESTVMAKAIELSRRMRDGEEWTEEELRDLTRGEAPPEVRKQLLVLQRRVRALFRPSPGGHCNFCPQPHKCPIVDDVRVRGTIRTEKDAERIGGELAVIKRAAKHRELALADYLENHASAPVTKPIADDKVKLRTYTHKAPGFFDAEGKPVVPLQNAKGRVAYAMVESTRTTSPSREQVEEAMQNAAQGVPTKAEDLYREASSSTLRLVKEQIPTDEAMQMDPLIDAALTRSLERLEEIRAVS